MSDVVIVLFVPLLSCCVIWCRLWCGGWGCDVVSFNPEDKNAAASWGDTVGAQLLEDHEETLFSLSSLKPSETCTVV